MVRNGEKSDVKRETWCVTREPPDVGCTRFEPPHTGSYIVGSLPLVYRFDRAWGEKILFFGVRLGSGGFGAWSNGMMDYWIDGVVGWWSGGLMGWWISGLVDWWKLGGG